MARALVGHDVAVTVATTDDDGPGKHLPGVTLGAETPHDGWKALYFRKQTEFYKTSMPLRRWLRAHVSEFDAVHIHAVFSYASLVAGRAAAAQGVPYIVRPLGVLSRWGMENRRRLVKAMSFRLLELPMLRRAAAMHYTSRMELDDAARFRLQNLQRVIPIGMDLSVFEALPDREVFSARFPETAKTRNVLFLSRLDAKKGLDLLIEAFASLVPEQPDLHLIICGSGDPNFMVELQAQATALGISEKITWAGMVKGDLRLAAFAAAEIFVLPSHAENFGIALLEAMAAGLPCLSTDQVALALDASREDAVQLTQREPLAIAEGLRSLLASESRRQALGRNAHALARRDFSLSGMGKALHQLYQEVSHHGV